MSNKPYKSKDISKLYIEILCTFLYIKEIGSDYATLQYTLFIELSLTYES